MRRVLSCLFVLLLLAFPCHALTAHFIGVGQGDATLFRFDDGRSMLVDVGPTEAGKRLVGYLRSAGVVSLDVVVLTHPHEDHIGGFNELIRAFRVGRVWDSGYEQGSRLQQSIMRTILKEGIRFGTPKAGFKETIGQAEVEILAPDRRWRGVGANNNSIILRVAYGRVSFLMTADVERAEWENHALPKSDILKLAHHGSRTGTDAAHLAAIAPKLAVATFGNGNRYKHPHREVLDALRATGVVLYATASGDVIVDTDGASFDVRQCAP
jgi:competence protein ComEC